MDVMITCCGTIVGTTGVILDYLHAFLEELKEKIGWHNTGTDTATHVWIIHPILPSA